MHYSMGSTIESEQRPRRPQPKTPSAVLIYRVYHCLAEIRRIPGIKRQGLEQWRLGRARPRLSGAESHPDVPLVVREERRDAVFRQSLGVRRIVSVADESLTGPVEFQQTIGECTDPKSAVLIFQH